MENVISLLKAPPLCVWSDSLQPWSSTGHSPFSLSLQPVHIWFLQLKPLPSPEVFGWHCHRWICDRWRWGRVQEGHWAFRLPVWKHSLPNEHQQNKGVFEESHLLFHLWTSREKTLRQWTINTWVLASMTDWTTNPDVLYRKGQSWLHLYRRLGSFGVWRGRSPLAEGRIAFYLNH